MVGASVPEWEIRGLGEVKQIYFFRCPDCIAYYESNPAAWKAFCDEQEQTKKDIARIRIEEEREEEEAERQARKEAKEAAEQKAREAAEKTSISVE